MQGMEGRHGRHEAALPDRAGNLVGLAGGPGDGRFRFLHGDDTAASLAADGAGAQLHPRSQELDRLRSGLAAKLREPPAQADEEEARVLEELGRLLLVVMADEL